MSAVPDLTGALPVLRCFLAAPDGRLSATIWRDQAFQRGWTEALHVPPAVPDQAEIEAHHRRIEAHFGPQFARMWHRSFDTTPVFVPHAAPSPTLDGCPSCGIHGWYPWARARWTLVTPLSKDVDPRWSPYLAPHPAVRDSVEEWAREPVVGRTWLVGVLDVAGTTVLADYGVRAQRAQVRALVLPSSVCAVTLPHDRWEVLTPSPWRERSADARTIERTLAYADAAARKAANYYEADLISMAEAFALSPEWGTTGARIRDKAHQGFV